MNARKFFPLVVVVAGILAYHNSFTGAFVRDDLESIPKNPTIRHLWPIWQCLSPPRRGGITVEGRPVINLSLAINYALGGYHVWGYHALNLAVHILAGLTLFGIVRRTLLQPAPMRSGPALRERFGAAADELALAVAVLWTVHPLQTESVTYMIQRAESIMGLFYLLTLYCFIRGAEPPPVGNGKWLMGDGSWRRLWYGLSVAACAFGMASKEVMATAPVTVMLYDRAFLSSSFREAWRRRRPLYCGLAATWLVLGWLLILTVRNALTLAGSGGITWRQYLATQPGVILDYLRLSLWPTPLGVRVGWLIARTWTDIVPSAIVVLILLAGTAWAWRKRTAWGFVGAWFFLILAPSSSFIPLSDLFCEHRMYLPLAAIVSVVVIGLYSVAGRRAFAVLAALTIGLGLLTWRRNQDYRSELSLWGAAAAKFPKNAAAHYYYALALETEGRITEASRHFEQALHLKTDSFRALNNLGLVLLQEGRVTEAIEHFEQALQIQPRYAEAHNNLGNALLQQGRVPKAMEQFKQALQINPRSAETHNNMGNALLQQGRVTEAVAQYEEALRINPELAEGQYDLGVARQRMGQMDQAVDDYQRALRLKPDYPEAHNNLGNSFLLEGKLPEAIAQYQQALRFKPDYPEAHYNLGVALEQTGRVPEAIGHYEQALRLKPDFAAAQKALARLRGAP
ncbi:MAG TPA: tetratricopeptide repeat protein [Verrucomicrobiae bacterium]|nr:tetratricopeptide repeat protein [Verrucomicrobiae bacterium]